MGPQFESLAARPRYRDSEPIETVRFELYTPSAVEPTPAETDSFYYPGRFGRDRRDGRDGPPDTGERFRLFSGREFLRDFTPNSGTELTLDSGPRYLQLNGTPIVIYLSFFSAVTIRKSDTTIRLSFDGPTPIRIGARSYPEAPEGTVTVTGSVRDTMRALSTFGPALKMTTAGPRPSDAPWSSPAGGTRQRASRPGVHRPAGHRRSTRTAPAAREGLPGGGATRTSSVRRWFRPAELRNWSPTTSSTPSKVTERTEEPARRLLRQAAFSTVWSQTKGIVTDESYNETNWNPDSTWTSRRCTTVRFPSSWKRTLRFPSRRFRSTSRRGTSRQT